MQRCWFAANFWVKVFLLLFLTSPHSLLQMPFPGRSDALLSVSPHASQRSGWVHVTGIPDSYSAMFHNTARGGPLYESQNAYLSCDLQLGRKERLAKLLWEPLDGFKRMNSTLETIATRSHATAYHQPTGEEPCLFMATTCVSSVTKGSLLFG